MRIGRIQKISLHIHPLFPLLCLLYFLNGQGKILLLYVFSLLAHEAGHIACASKLHLPIACLEITPFGGSMQIDGMESLSSGAAFMLAAAGIGVNGILLAGFCALFLSHGRLLYLLGITVNLWMLLLNLLPVLPLDGGRMVLALLSKCMERSTAFKALLLMGRILCALMLCSVLLNAFQGKIMLLRLTLACYLLYASALEERSCTARYLTSYLTRRQRLEKGGVLPVQQLCASADLHVIALFSHLHAGAYHCVTVVDPYNSSRKLGVLEEDRLLDALLEQPLASLQDVLNN